MSPHQTSLVNGSIHEIERLRRENDVLRATNDVVQIFGAALLGRRNEGGCMSVDIVWELRRMLQENEAAQKAQVGETAQNPFAVPQERGESQSE